MLKRMGVSAMSLVTLWSVIDFVPLLMSMTAMIIDLIFLQGGSEEGIRL